jgi:hypothetical protein
MDVLGCANSTAGGNVDIIVEFGLKADAADVFVESCLLGYVADSRASLLVHFNFSISGKFAHRCDIAGWRLPTITWSKLAMHVRLREFMAKRVLLLV